MTLAPGQRLGPYLIESPLGAGGMGEVYRATDTRLHRPVAVKVLPSTVESAGLRERFDREARVLSNLNHPHICVVYDAGQQDGIVYLVMELLEGESLARRLTRGALEIRQALTIALQVASALDRAHRVGVVHRDVKPENIMLTKTGAKLLDFGLAKPAPVSSDVAGLTRTLLITGQGAFPGSTSATVISAILRDSPRPMTELQPLVPPALDAMVRTCLEKD